MTAAAQQQRGRGGELRIDRETTLLAIPRGDEELRLVFTEATTADGKQVSWHSLRVFYRPQGSNEWRPGKAGVSIRRRELEGVARALARAAGLEIAAGEEGF